MLEARVAQILINDDVCCMEFSSAHGSFFMLGLEMAPNLNVGVQVDLSFKSSDVFISLEKLHSCSVRNEIQAIITDMTRGEILTVVSLKSDEFEFESVISSISAKVLNLQVGDNIYAYIKSTSISISKIYD